LKGAPYVKEEFESGIRKAVISEDVARRLYGTIDVVGKTICLSYQNYSICGVVKNVSTLAEAAYAQVWAPYTTNNQSENLQFCEDLLGVFRCYILAHNNTDFDDIRNQVNRNVSVLNASQKEQNLVLRGQPDSQFVQMTRKWANEDAKVKDTVIQYSIVLTLLLLVPAINLSGMTHSRMKKRMSEIGVRKAFGASRKELLGQVLYENLVYTILGGIFGLILSYLSVILMKAMLLNNLMAGYLSGASSLNVSMLLQPSVFLYAFIFCLLLNLMSAGIPAWKASRIKIVNALNDK